MKSAFLNTSGLIAVVNTDDQWHNRAREAWEKLFSTNATLVTSSLIIVEIADGLSQIKRRPLAIQLVDSLRASNRITIIDSTPNLEQRAWELFKARMDKEWGMTDCASIVLMHDLGINDAFSLDSDFEQAGFNLVIP